MMMKLPYMGVLLFLITTPTHYFDNSEITNNKKIKTKVIRFHFLLITLQIEIFSYSNRKIKAHL